MIRLGEKEVTVVAKGDTLFQTIYKGAVIVWQAIRSCFGAGYWLNEKPWLNTESWKN